MPTPAIRTSTTYSPATTGVKEPVYCTGREEEVVEVEVEVVVSPPRELRRLTPPFARDCMAMSSLARMMGAPLLSASSTESGLERCRIVERRGCCCELRLSRSILSKCLSHVISSTLDDRPRNPTLSARSAPTNRWPLLLKAPGATALSWATAVSRASECHGAVNGACLSSICHRMGVGGCSLVAASRCPNDSRRISVSHTVWNEACLK
mmetsp:Transcript_22259/g.48446  ORF Transcript_22259/g.48446 Transcript_22259/m.48446 type:complete len:209 (-) Transcript_22259:481-1107(-)